MTCHKVLADIKAFILSFRYLLDIRWFKQWKKYVGYDSWDTLSAGDEAVNPGPIDNSVLFKGVMNIEIHF